MLVAIDLFELQPLGEPQPSQDAGHKPHDFDLVTVAPPPLRDLRQCGRDERKPSLLGAQFAPSAVVAVVGAKEIDRAFQDGVIDLRGVDRADGRVDFDDRAGLYKSE